MVLQRISSLSTRTVVTSEFCFFRFFTQTLLALELLSQLFQGGLLLLSKTLRELLFLCYDWIKFSWNLKFSSCKSLIFLIKFIPHFSLFNHVDYPFTEIGCKGRILSHMLFIEIRLCQNWSEPVESLRFNFFLLMVLQFIH